jgi:hypothetical protein
MQHTSFSLLYCAGLVLAGFASAAHAAIIDNLGTLGGSYSRGFGINASGQVTGGSNAAPGPEHSQRGFLYTLTPTPGGGGRWPIWASSTAVHFASPSTRPDKSLIQRVYDGPQHAYIYTGVPAPGAWSTWAPSAEIQPSHRSHPLGQVTGNAGIVMGSTAARLPLHRYAWHRRDDAGSGHLGGRPAEASASTPPGRLSETARSPAAASPPSTPSSTLARRAWTAR